MVKSRDEFSWEELCGIPSTSVPVWNHQEGFPGNFRNFLLERAVRGCPGRFSKEFLDTPHCFGKVLIHQKLDLTSLEGFSNLNNPRILIFHGALAHPNVMKQGTEFNSRDFLIMFRIFPTQNRIPFPERNLKMFRPGCEIK